MNIQNITAEKMLAKTQAAIKAKPVKELAKKAEIAKMLAETPEQKEKRLTNEIIKDIYATISCAASTGYMEATITCNATRAGTEMESQNLKKKVMLKITPELRKQGFQTLWKMHQMDLYEAFALDELHISWDPKCIWHRLYGQTEN